MKVFHILPGDLGYSLSLSDGSNWSLSGGGEYVNWVDKLATIMELKKTEMNGSPRLVFYESGHTNARPPGPIDIGVPASFPSGSEEGWNFYEHSTLRIWHHHEISDVIGEVKINLSREIELINMWFSLHPIYQRSISRGGLPFHGGLVEMAGKGFLLVASGGTGKSTCCARLPEGWKALCDDEALVVLTEKKTYRAHPFPTWSDYLFKRNKKTLDVQYSVPLSGLFFLEQSEADAVEPLGRGKTAVLMTESATQICEKFWRKLREEDQKKSRAELFDNACAMAKTIPAYRLSVARDGRFWEKMEEVIRS